MLPIPGETSIPQKLIFNATLRFCGQAQFVFSHCWLFWRACCICQSPSSLPLLDLLRLQPGDLRLQFLTLSGGDPLDHGFVLPRWCVSAGSARQRKAKKSPSSDFPAFLGIKLSPRFVMRPAARPLHHIAKRRAKPWLRMKTCGARAIAFQHLDVAPFPFRRSASST